MIVKDADLRDNPPATDDDPLDVQHLRPATGLQRQPTRGARRPASVARRGRTTRTRERAARRDAGRRRRDAGRVLRRRARRAAPRLQLPVHQRAVRSAGDAGDRRGAPRRSCPPARGRRGPARTTTCRASPPAGPADDPAQARAALRHAARPAGHAGALPGRRDRARRRRRSPDRTCATRSGVRYWPAYAGPRRRCARRCRGGDAPGGGFTDPDVATVAARSGTPTACNVEDQRDDPGSMLDLARDLIALRRERADLASGDYRRIAAEPGIWAWSRGERMVVAVNMTDRRVRWSGCPDGCASGQTATVTGSRSPAPSAWTDGRPWWWNGRSDPDGDGRRRHGTPRRPDGSDGLVGQPGEAPDRGGGGSRGSPRRGGSGRARSRTPALPLR